MGWDKAAEHTMEVAEKLHELDDLLAGTGDHKWYFQKMRGYAKALFERFAPWKTDDKVKLIKTPNITSENSPGWLHCKHFLIAGAIGTVKSVDLDHDTLEFEAWVEFDDESWIPDIGNEKGIPQPVSSKHVFHFREDYLTKI